MKKLLALLLTAVLLGGAVPALAAEEAASTPLPDWAYSELADSYAMGLVDDNFQTVHSGKIDFNTCSLNPLI